MAIYYLSHCRKVQSKVYASGLGNGTDTVTGHYVNFDSHATPPPAPVGNVMALKRMRTDVSDNEDEAAWEASVEDAVQGM